MNEEKEALRRSLRAQRAALSGHEIAAASKKIVARALTTAPWQNNGSVHIYTSRAAWGEIDTVPLIAELTKRYPRIQITRGDVIATDFVPSEQFDVIVVPVLGFDSSNYRLGLGRGWYDRFLSAQTHAYTIGLAYAWARIESLPHEVHDVSLDVIITG